MNAVKRLRKEAEEADKGPLDKDVRVLELALLSTDINNITHMFHIKLLIEPATSRHTSPV